MTFITHPRRAERTVKCDRITVRHVRARCCLHWDGSQRGRFAHGRCAVEWSSLFTELCSRPRSRSPSPDPYVDRCQSRVPPAPASPVPDKHQTTSRVYGSARSQALHGNGIVEYVFFVVSVTQHNCHVVTVPGGRTRQCTIPFSCQILLRHVNRPHFVCLFISQTVILKASIPN